MGGISDQKPVSILVVGNDEHDKSGVLESLTSVGAWEICETNGVRSFTCQSTARTVIDTTPLVNIEGRSPTAVARRWISRNGLRRILFGKLVVVVCVITGAVRDRCQWKMFSYFNCWVDVFGLIFKDHKSSIMMLVNTEAEENVAESTKSEIEHFVVEHGFSKNNITYSDLKGGDHSVRKVVFDGIRLTKIRSDGKISKLHSFLSSSPSKGEKRRSGDDTAAQLHDHAYPTVTPFFMEEVSSENDRFGPWGPERLILFGRTGSGKSTFAQMMTLGAIRPDSKKFIAKSGIRGITKEVEHGEGRGWYVLDTPGFGESKADSESTISTQEAEKKIKMYVKMLEGTFSHYIFVLKRDRLDQLDERLWKFFMALFGKDIKQHFSIVVSGADDDWVQDNMSDLTACFEDCTSFLSAEFPPINEEDPEIEAEYQVIRTESLLGLEEKLAALNRTDMHCQYGRHSKMHVTNERERANIDQGIEKDLRMKFLNEGANACFAVSSFVSLLVSPITEVTSKLTLDDGISLLPS